MFCKPDLSERLEEHMMALYHELSECVGVVGGDAILGVDRLVEKGG